jgi:hypothetical protein
MNGRKISLRNMEGKLPLGLTYQKFSKHFCLGQLIQEKAKEVVRVLSRRVSAMKLC